MRCQRAACRACAAALGLVLPVCARADDTRTSLRIDALGDTQRNGGVVVLQAGERGPSWASAEALVWTGGYATAGAGANALVFALRLREPHGLGEFRVGRFLFATGAILPVQVDGASAMVRLPWGTRVEAVAGSPVASVATSAVGPGAFEWLVGGRVSHTLASRVTFGASYLERRQAGEIADERAGIDFTTAPTRWLDVSARAGYDITSPGISDALLSAAARIGDLRFELFATDRSPSRLLPATSVFTVFGDFPSQSAGSSAHWKAAPRLDLWLTGAAQSVGGVYGGNGSARAVLKLDDRGSGSLGLEARRQDVSTARWTGVRAIATRPFFRTLRASAEVELVVPDCPQGKGVAWPWALVSLAWRPSERLEFASALETASTPQHEFELNALVRASLLLGAK